MRQEELFDRGWLFHPGDIEVKFPTVKGPAYVMAKTQRMKMGPASVAYNDRTDDFRMDDLKEINSDRWITVDLPHDFMVTEPVNKDENNALGFVEYKNAWYRKHFKLSKDDMGKRITLLFDGIATHATVYLNGCLMKHNFCGYTSFEVDITDVVKYDEPNVLAVYVNTEEHEGWWYEGGGIYRSVRLVKTDLCAVDLWGIYARPTKKSDTLWEVEARVTLRNDDVKTHALRAVVEIVDEAGETVTTGNISGKIADKDKREFRTVLSIENPLLWSPDEPNRYRMRVTVLRGKNAVDVDEVRFGFRTFRLDPDKGMFINGKHYKIKGLCGHADCGLLGKAVPDNIHRYKVRLMKEMGANGYRTSHYPQAEALMEELDKNGFIVMDETRWFESTDEGKAQLEMLMKRDRNRPSIFFWSVGNEEPHHTTEEGRRIAQTLMSLAHKLDDTRVIMTAVSYSPDKATVYDELEAIGINYNWTMYEKVHEKYPTKAVFSSECCATGTTRGWYYDEDPNKAFLPAYDRDTNSEFRGREFTWKYLDSNDWLLGGYQWIAFEHRGEATWPRLCSQSGAIDLFLQKKDAFYQNKSFWSEKPMVHLLPHWNFEGLEGHKIRVVSYTNQPRVELFLNGRSLGAVALERHDHAEWQVPYEVGRLEVKAYNENGDVTATDVRITSKKPYALALHLDTEDVRANGKDVAILTCTVVDENGIEVPDAIPTVSFTANGAGRVLSTGSDITEHDTVYKSVRRMRAGRIGVAVKLGSTPGDLTVIAEAEGLRRAILVREVK